MKDLDYSNDVVLILTEEVNFTEIIYNLKIEHCRENALNVHICLT